MDDAGDVPRVRAVGGSRAGVSELPTGTVTFLFTDLEGSTRLWEQYPEAMRAALAVHDALLRGAVEAHRGQVVKSTGDGLHAVFGHAEDAIAAAVAAQLALDAERWAGTGPLRVRMGLHTGTAEAREGDYFGPALNRAASSAYRMAGVAAGDIDVAEVHDCFAIAELIAYEELGFCKKGEAGAFVAAGRSEYGGDVVVNPRGGLIGCGHPLGATGVAQAAEIFAQLRDEAGARQVPGAAVGLSHNNSGMGEHVVMIYGRDA